MVRAGERITENEANASCPAPPLEVKPKSAAFYRAGERITENEANASCPAPPLNPHGVKIAIPSATNIDIASISGQNYKQKQLYFKGFLTMSISGIRFACTTAPRFSGKTNSNAPNFFERIAQQAQQTLSAGLDRFLSLNSVDVSAVQAASETNLIQDIRDANGGVLECEKLVPAWLKNLEP
jgi:hypothetical protein